MQKQVDSGMFYGLRVKVQFSFSLLRFYSLDSVTYFEHVMSLTGSAQAIVDALDE